MKRLQSILGYTWAAVALPLLIATFFGMNLWAGGLAAATGVTISPRFTGGPVVRTVDHGTYRTLIHRPVFDALIGQRKTGFVQVDFVGAADSLGATATKSLPSEIREEVDFDGDGTADFRVDATIATAKATITVLNPRVLGLEEVLKLEKGLGIRVRLRNHVGA